MVLKNRSIVTLNWRDVGSRGQVFHTALLVCSVSFHGFWKLPDISLKFLLPSDCFTEQHVALFLFTGFPEFFSALSMLEFVTLPF